MSDQRTLRENSRSLSTKATEADVHGVDRGGGVHGVVVGDLQSDLHPTKGLLEKTVGL